MGWCHCESRDPVDGPAAGPEITRKSGQSVRHCVNVPARQCISAPVCPWALMPRRRCANVCANVSCRLCPRYYSQRRTKTGTLHHLLQLLLQVRDAALHFLRLDDPCLVLRFSHRVALAPTTVHLEIRVHRPRPHLG